MGIGHVDPVSGVILWVTLILFLGLVGRYLAHRMGQPGVLGELLMGILLGSLLACFDFPLLVVLRENGAVSPMMHHLLAGLPLTDAIKAALPDATNASLMLRALSGPFAPDWIKIAYVLDVFSRYGVIFLLFMVGLESSLSELKQTGKASLNVALIGVVAPVLLGLGVLWLMTPTLPFASMLFIATTLSATSVGITARVLKDMHQLQTREAKTILGAAMIDDVLGLVLLTLVTGLVMQGYVDVMLVVRVCVFSGLFFVVALWVAPWALRYTTHWLRFLEPWEAKLFTSFLFLMCLSWAATWVNLASIIGAFLAGLLLHEGFFSARETKKTLSIKNVLAPFEAIFAPLFFMLMGMQVNVHAFFDVKVLLMSLALLVVAVIGKLLSGLGGARHDDRWMIGIGMLPRGEVGLVFASMGKTLGVISEALFASIVLMVVVTTVMVPFWLTSRQPKRSVI